MKTPLVLANWKLFAKDNWYCLFTKLLFDCSSKTVALRRKKQVKKYYVYISSNSSSLENFKEGKEKFLYSACNTSLNLSMHG